MNFAVVGAGAFGRNHLRVYHELQAATSSSARPVRLTAIVEAHPDRASELRASFAEAAQPPLIFSSAEELLHARAAGQVAVDAASVCVPTSAHYEVAAALLEAGIDLLVEKPIAATLSQADQLIALAQKQGRILQVGHLERFNPAILAAEAIRNAPMFFEAHRLSLFSPRSLDVDVVLDLMVHDLDIVLALAGSPVHSVHAVGLPIVSPKVDIANVRLEFESGCVANFTASRVSTERVRKLRFFQPHQYVSIDYARKDLLIIDVEPEAFAAAADLSALLSQPPAGSPLPPGLKLHKPQLRDGEPLRLEIESFVQCVETRQPPRVSGRDGREALALALTINEKIAEHARKTGLSRIAPAR
ncbi:MULTISPECIES: Gfo/Idh/MocA family oxidoreductase [Acidobacterium]|uniref:Gfo/Idh/MocA family protein n=1 Tax=Acidobacterium TaxID=33973 RepID=UPI0005A2C4D0|nr:MULTISPECIES: Gfo/Idh/MocA family oxidoreductase [Acidobacterium]